jgi:hypothetical protein
MQFGFNALTFINSLIQEIGGLASGSNQRFALGCLRHEGLRR